MLNFVIVVGVSAVPFIVTFSCVMIGCMSCA